MRWDLLFDQLFNRRPATPAPGGGTLPITPSNLFTEISRLVMDPAVQVMEQLAIAFANEMSLIITIVMAMWLGWTSVNAALGNVQPSRVWVELFKMAPIWWLVTNQDALFRWVIGLFVYILPTSLSNIAGSALGSGSVPVDSDAFGAVLNDALAMGLRLWNMLGITDVVAAILVFILLLASIISIAYSWWVWFKAGLWLVVLATLAPVALLCAIAPATRGIFTRWLDLMTGFIALKVVAVIFVQILLGVEGVLVRQMMDANTTAVQGVMLIFCAICVFVAMIFMAFDIPRVASALGGGVTLHGPGGATAFGVGYLTRRFEANRRRRHEQEQRARERAAGNPSP